MLGPVTVRLVIVGEVEAGESPDPGGRTLAATWSHGKERTHCEILSSNNLRNIPFHDAVNGDIDQVSFYLEESRRWFG